MSRGNERLIKIQSPRHLTFHNLLPHVPSIPHPSPFRIVDEINQSMDSLNERLVHKHNRVHRESESLITSTPTANPIVSTIFYRMSLQSLTRSRSSTAVSPSWTPTVDAKVPIEPTVSCIVIQRLSTFEVVDEINQLMAFLPHVSPIRGPLLSCR